MSDPMADHLHAHDENDEEAWDYGDHMPNVLWGRVGILAAVVIIAFLIGRISAGGGISPADLDRAEARAASLRTQNEDLRTQIALLESDGVATSASEEADSEATTGEGEEADQGAEAPPAQSDGPKANEKVQGLTYKVRDGDNLSRIASKFYGDGSLGSFIAEANGITDPASISVGQKIVIPDRPQDD